VPPFFCPRMHRLRIFPHPIQVALAGMLIVILWQFLVVAGHGWNLTALFCVGDGYPPPPALQPSLYQYRNTPGFDAQFYLYIAHDVRDEQGFSEYLDNKTLRLRRILFPALAALLSFGQPSWVTPAYVVVMWLAVLIGMYALARLCTHWGLPPVLGLCFLLIPATIISVDRMMPDVGIALATVLLLLALAEDRLWIALLALTVAPLFRETGLAFTGAWGLWFALRGMWSKAVLGGLTAIPALAWMAWLRQQYGADGSFWFGWPFEGILRRLTLYDFTQGPSFIFKLTLVLEYLGAVGVALSFVAAIALWLRGERSLALLAALVYTLGISFFAKEDMWWDAYCYTRTAGPVAVILALIALQSRRWWLAVPMLLATPRIALQLMWVAYDSLRNIMA
jgi:hypothetical protein